MGEEITKTRSVTGDGFVKLNLCDEVQELVDEYCESISVYAHGSLDIRKIKSDKLNAINKIIEAQIRNDAEISKKYEFDYRMSNTKEILSQIQSEPYWCEHIIWDERFRLWKIDNLEMHKYWDQCPVKECHKERPNEI